MLMGEIARRAAEAAADIEEMHSPPHAQLLGEIDRRLPATDVELVDRRQIRRIEAIDVLARLCQRLQDHSLERAVRAVLRDVLFDAFHAASSPSLPHFRPKPHL
jgi:hypothetical protein